MNGSKAPEQSDASLLRRFQRGEQDAATRLYVRYARRLHGLARSQTAADLQSRVDPDDIVQSVFRTFFRRAQDGQYEVPDGEELWKLFLVISLNKIRDAAGYHRAGKRDVSRTVRLSDSVLAGKADSGDDAEAVRMLQMVIDDVLQGLTEPQREIVTLRLQGVPVAEIATRAKRARRSVERTLQKFREILRNQIDEERDSGAAT